MIRVPPSQLSFLLLKQTQRWESDGEAETCTRWISVVSVWHETVEETSENQPTSLSISWGGSTIMIPADQIPPPGIPNMQRIILVYCLPRPQTQKGSGWFEVSRWLNVSLQQVEQRVQRSSCNRSINGLNLVQVHLLLVIPVTSCVTLQRLHWI